MLEPHWTNILTWLFTYLIVFLIVCHISVLISVLLSSLLSPPLQGFYCEWVCSLNTDKNCQNFLTLISPICLKCLQKTAKTCFSFFFDACSCCLRVGWSNQSCIIVTTVKYSACYFHLTTSHTLLLLPSFNPASASFITWSAPPTDYSFLLITSVQSMSLIYLHLYNTGLWNKNTCHYPWIPLTKQKNINGWTLPDSGTFSVV